MIFEGCIVNGMFDRFFLDDFTYFKTSTSPSLIVLNFVSFY